MNRKIKLTVSPAERTTIVAALMDYSDHRRYPSFADLTQRIATQDTADDGPEVALLRTRSEGWDA